MQIAASGACADGAVLPVPHRGLMMAWWLIGQPRSIQAGIQEEKVQTGGCGVEQSCSHWDTEGDQKERKEYPIKDE